MFTIAGGILIALAILVALAWVDEWASGSYWFWWIFTPRRKSRKN